MEEIELINRFYNNIPLNSQFPIDSSILYLGIISLYRVATDQSNVTEISKIIVILTNFKVTTLGNLVDMTQGVLKELPGLGAKSITLLFSLLKRISNNPEVLMTEDEIRRKIKLDDIKMKLRDMEMIQ